MNSETVPLADLESDLDYRVELRVEQEERGGIELPILTARVVATNVSSRAVSVEHSGCSLLLEAYRPGGAAAAPLWRQARGGTWPTSSTYGCPLPLLRQVLQPGESYDGGEGVGRFAARVPVAEVYGDSLPTGRYAVAAVLHANRDSVRLPAGEAVLPASPFALGPEYPLDGFRYSASSTPVAGSPGTYEVRVVVRNAGLRPDLTRYLRSECPVVLHAYATAAEQRTAAVWSGGGARSAGRRRDKGADQTVHRAGGPGRFAPAGQVPFHGHCHARRRARRDRADRMAGRGRPRASLTPMSLRLAGTSPLASRARPSSMGPFKDLGVRPFLVPRSRSDSMAKSSPIHQKDDARDRWRGKTL